MMPFGSAPRPGRGLPSIEVPTYRHAPKKRLAMSPCGGDWAPAGTAPRLVTTSTAGSTTAMIPRIARSCSRCVRSPCHRDVLRLQEFHHAFLHTLAADARLLHAAER